MPQSDEERLSWLRLSRSRNVGAATFQRLMSRFGGAQKALDALPELATRGGAQAYQVCSYEQAEREFVGADVVGAKMLCLGAPDYPNMLAEIPDPPPFLWALGGISLASKPNIAIIGARNASSLGLRMGRSLAIELSERGYVISSGLARGVDAAAHKAAIETNTVAVMAGGVDVIYPSENTNLYADICKTGLILSEAPMGLQPQGRHFPRRNRIVSGLSKGVVLIEAAARSGSLITARYALEQGREAMAVPGSPLDPRSAGCNDLIRQGAALIRSADDVEEALSAPRTLSLEEPISDFMPEVPTAKPDPVHIDLPARLTELLSTAPIDADTLGRDSGASPSQLAGALLELEMAGAIERRSGGFIALAN
ncbi:MAG: DNA-processing protein DprA [Pikeienuella sp.]